MPSHICKAFPGVVIDCMPQRSMHMCILFLCVLGASSSKSKKIAMFWSLRHTLHPRRCSITKMPLQLHGSTALSNMPSFLLPFQVHLIECIRATNGSNGQGVGQTGPTRRRFQKDKKSFEPKVVCQAGQTSQQHFHFLFARMSYFTIHCPSSNCTSQVYTSR